MLLAVSGQLVEGLHLDLAEIDDFQVLLDARWRDRLGQDDDAPANEVGQKDGARLDRVLLGDLGDCLLLEKGGAGGSERRVGLEEDTGDGGAGQPWPRDVSNRNLPLLLAERMQIVLRVIRVQLDLIGGRHDRGLLEQILQEGDTHVGHTNLDRRPDDEYRHLGRSRTATYRLDLARLDELLHLLPSLDVGPLSVLVP